MSLFSAANLALAGFPLTNALGENLLSRHWNMFNLRLCNAATIRYSLLKFGHIHLCDKDYTFFSPHCCKCNSFGYIAAIRCGNACHGPDSDSVYSASEHRYTLENRYGFWPQTGCVTVPGCEAAVLVARQRFPYRSRFNFSVKNMENMPLCNAICDTMHIDFNRKIYCGANDASIGF